MVFLISKLLKKHLNIYNKLEDLRLLLNLVSFNKKGEKSNSLLYIFNKKRVRFFLTLFYYMISPASSDAVSAA